MQYRGVKWLRWLGIVSAVSAIVYYRRTQMKQVIVAGGADITRDTLSHEVVRTEVQAMATGIVTHVLNSADIRYTIDNMLIIELENSSLAY